MLWTAAYLGSCLGINLAYSWAPDQDMLWSACIGAIFVLRDLVQARIGHWSLVPMVVACVLSWVLGDPAVAVASTAAFAVGGTLDWIVFSLSRLPLRVRVLASSACSVPADTAVFCMMLGLYDPVMWGVTIASKMAGVAVSCAVVVGRDHPGRRPVRVRAAA